jgi:hypothetical protein
VCIFEVEGNLHGILELMVGLSDLLVLHAIEVSVSALCICAVRLQIQVPGPNLDKIRTASLPIRPKVEQTLGSGEVCARLQE